MQNLEKYIQIFDVDSRKELAEMNKVLVSLEKDLSNPDLINALFRKAHSLKGMGATMGYNRLSELGHALEEPLNRIREKKFELTREIIDLLFEGVDLLEALVDEAVTGASPKLDYGDFLSRIKGLTDSGTSLPTTKKAIVKFQMPKTISVAARALDDLIGLVGEMIIHRNRLLELNQPLPSNELVEEMETAQKLVNELHDQVLKIRMMPFSLITDFVYRTVRDLAKRQDKEVDFSIEGDKEVELDRTVAEELIDPLIHLIRNAVDHGIESPSVRQEKGKSVGRISVRFSKESDMVKVEVEDDGQGIDLARVKKKALERGIINEKTLASLSEEAILMLLCEPGLSTSYTVTDVSGRGVGLDVVKSSVESLGGSIYISTELGAGSRFALKVPATTHIIFALLIRSGSQVFAVPTSKIQATTKINTKSTHDSFIFYDTQVSLVHLRDLLMLDDSARDDSGPYPVIVTETEGKKIGVIADEILRVEQIYVKPLGSPLDRVDGLYGVTILGDGRIVLVLDLERLG
jgi:two-component system chemotaxis sensor kinase CheA